MEGGTLEGAEDTGPLDREDSGALALAEARTICRTAFAMSEFGSTLACTMRAASDGARGGGNLVELMCTSMVLGGGRSLLSRRFSSTAQDSRVFAAASRPRRRGPCKCMNYMRKIGKLANMARYPSDGATGTEEGGGSARGVPSQATRMQNRWLGPRSRK